MITNLFYPITNNIKEEEKNLELKNLKKLEKECENEMNIKKRGQIAFKKLNSLNKINNIKYKNVIEKKKKVNETYTKKFNTKTIKPEINIFSNNDIINSKKIEIINNNLEEDESIFNEQKLINELKIVDNYQTIRNLIKENNCFN